MSRPAEFNPFDKPLGDIAEPDLRRLATVSEGLFVEYKGARAPAAKIAKSVASFANSHGGILFLGVQADAKTNLATSFPGVSPDANYIHDAVRDSVSPFPEFEVFNVALASGKVIPMVVVPEGMDTPYIHTDGRIYRRQQASSDPVEENNRFSIDELYSRRKELKETLQRFRSIEYGFNKAEDDQPFLAIYINPMPYNSFAFADFFSATRLEAVKKHFSEKFQIEESIEGKPAITVAGNMDFDQAMFYESSICLGFVAKRNLAYHGMSVELFSNGNIRVLQPLQTISNPALADAQFEEILSQLAVTVEAPAKFIPVRSICAPLLGVLQRYLNLLSLEKYKGKIEFSFETMNCYRTIVYSRSAAYRNFVSRFGVPLCMKPRQLFPSVPRSIPIGELLDSQTFSLLEIMRYVLSAFGLPSPDSINIAVEEMNANLNAG